MNLKLAVKQKGVKMSEERYKIENDTGVVDNIVGLKTVKITDKITGTSASGTAGTTEKAKEEAWKKLEKKQGPPPSKKTK